MRVADRLRAFVEASSPGCALTITREAAAEWLAEEPLEGAPAEAKERDELTAAEWAALEQRANGTVCTWLAAGLVPGAYKMNGREWRIPRESIRAFHAEQAKAHPAPKRAPVVQLPSRDEDMGSWKACLRKTG